MFAVKRALFTWLAAAPELAGVQVSYAWPGRSQDRECIYGGFPEATQRYAVMTAGRKPRDEDATILIRIEVAQPGNDVQAADQRVEELGAVLETLLADNVTLGGLVTGVRYGGITAVESEYVPLDGSIESTATYHVTFSSRLF